MNETDHIANAMDRDLPDIDQESESQDETLARLNADVAAECQAIRDQAAREQNKEAAE